MQQFNIEMINSWDRFYRANFINSLSGFKSANLIGTINKNGQPNLAIFSNIVHLGADPALIGFINRPLLAAPHTIANIEATKQYSINHINKNIVAKAHQTSAKYPANVNEFYEVGFTEKYIGNFAAPFVAESNIQYAMELVEIVPIKHNNTFLVIGSITGVYLQDGLVQNDGFINIENANSVASVGIDTYYTCSKIAKFEYAKDRAK